MKIIKIDANENGYRPPLQDWSKQESPEGYAFCPDDFVSIFYSTNPAGFVNIQVVGKTVTAMTVNQEALDAYLASLPQPETPSPSQLREDAYNTQKVISWYGDMLTVTEASQKWQYYAAEGNTAKTDELTALIAEAKASIREQYPDEEANV